ncbi:MAG: hypothetical protein LBS21_05645 [Clostridiales bacterium]|nr:hypothetical protein [Clostridiales bacterium]
MPNFIEDERLANAARKKDIPEEIRVYVNKEALPFAEYESGNPKYAPLIRVQKAAEAKIGLEMLKLPHGMNNIDIKLAYGVSQFEYVVRLEENYENCVMALIFWAEQLYKAEMFTQAEDVLKESIRIKSDHSKSYTMLCDIYVKLSYAQKLDELFNAVTNDNFMEHNHMVRNKIRAYLARGKAKMEDNS